jgi:hypothetical protein
MISGDFNANKEIFFGICSQSSTYQNHRLYDLGWSWLNRSDEKGPDSNGDDSNYPMASHQYTGFHRRERNGL